MNLTIYTADKSRAAPTLAVPTPYTVVLTVTPIYPVIPTSVLPLIPGHTLV
jgi:hypothetical protein